MTASGAEEFIRLTARTAYLQLYMYARSIPLHLTTSYRVVWCVDSCSRKTQVCREIRRGFWTTRLASSVCVQCVTNCGSCTSSLSFSLLRMLLYATRGDSSWRLVFALTSTVTQVEPNVTSHKTRWWCWHRAESSEYKHVICTCWHYELQTYKANAKKHAPVHLLKKILYSCRSNIHSCMHAHIRIHTRVHKHTHLTFLLI